jgi:hypothetical protein
MSAELIVSLFMKLLMLQEVVIELDVLEVLLGLTKVLK